MKANELMIGDWVDFYHPYEPEKKIVTRHRVTDIYGSCLDGLVGISNHNNPVHADHIEPIKITPEILEKNGFHKEWDEDIMLMACDTIIVETGDNYKLYKDGKMYLRRVLAPLYYVHQLQHALRLCGIEKEIVI